MLSHAIAAHPDTEPAVLAVIAAHGTTLAAANARLRLRWDSPWHGLDVERLHPDDLLALLNHPNGTPTTRHQLLRTTHPDNWYSYVADRDADPDDLRTLAETLAFSRDVPIWCWWSAQIAANPRTPADLARSLLRQLTISEGFTPALALAIMDNHDLSLADLDLTDPHMRPEVRERMRTVVSACVNVARAGSLLAYLEVCPWTSREAHTQVEWEGLLAHTSNPDVLVRAVQRALEPARRGGADLALRLAVANRYVPTDVTHQLAEIVLEQAGAVHESSLRAVTAAIAARPAVTRADVLSLAVRHATASSLRTLVEHPHLTAEHLDALAPLLPAVGKPAIRQRCALGIAMHPNASTWARRQASRHIPELPSGHRSQAHASPLVMVAHGAPLPAVTANREHDPSLRRGIEPTIAKRLTEHPALLTNPVLARAALALADTFTGTLDNLLTTAEHIVN